MLKPGDAAPLFELPNADLEMTTSADIIDQRNLVLYF